jgi:hypothetical protein
MVSVAELLQDPALRGVRVLAGDAAASTATSVRLVENRHALAVLPAETLAVLSDAASSGCLGYKLDVNLRQAAGQGVAALLFTGHSAPTTVEATAAALAARSGVVLLSAPAGLDLVELVVAASAGIAGSAEAALRKADEALAQLHAVESTLEPGDTATLLEIGSGALAEALTIRAGNAGELFARVRLDGQDVATIAAPTPAGHAAAAGRLIVAAVAAAMERSLSAAAHGPGIPIRSRSAVLSDILVADDANSARLSEQAHRLGLAIDGWHRALMLHAVAPAEPLSFDFLQTLGEAALRAVRATPGSWHLARSEDRLVLVEMWQRQPRDGVGQLGMQSGRDLLENLHAQFPQLEIRCGVGTPHQGLRGLRASVAEARAALAPPSRSKLVGYDVAGLQSMLLEWYGTDTARQAVRELLTPLESLGGERAATAISTLQAYLDEQGSLVRVAERLHLHRNAVVYRMRQIRKLLDVDLDDADQRLAVQLACRARLLR